MAGSRGDAVANATTFLFVPGDRPERFTKAYESGADLVIVDLEDAVAPENKAAALDATVAALSDAASDLRVLVRIHEASNLATLSPFANGADPHLLGIVVPKSETAEQLAAVVAALPNDVPVVALVETALGVANARDIAETTGVARLAFGAIDFANDVNASVDAVFDYARSALVIAARAAGLPAPIDSPCVNFSDAEIVTAETVRARAFGFEGKLCIHPAQLDAVRDGFHPTADEVEGARRIVEFEGGAVQLDGAMIDKPVVDRAKRILARAEGRRT